MNLIRNLAGLLITAAMLPICILAFRFTVAMPFDYDAINDEIALCQLRELLLISYDLQADRNELNFRYQNDTFRLAEVNGKMILQPGTQIYLNGIDGMHFEKADGCIYVCYSKGRKDYRRIITGEKGIHIDDFSDCDVSDDDADRGEE